MFPQAETHALRCAAVVPSPILGAATRVFVDAQTGQGIDMEEALMTKNKGGRPKAETPRTEPVGFRCTIDEMSKLEQLADAYGITVGEFCRTKALGARMPKPPVPAINIKKYQELSRLSANLNQISKAINEGRVTDVGRDFMQKIYDEVTELRRDLLGRD